MEKVQQQKNKVIENKQTSEKNFRKTNNSVKRIKSKQQGHNVNEKLVKEAETLLSDTGNFFQKNLRSCGQ